MLLVTIISIIIGPITLTVSLEYVDNLNQNGYYYDYSNNEGTACILDQHIIVWYI